MSSIYNYVQTFYINKDRVNLANEVMLTSLRLFFRVKPDVSRSLSGSDKPGVNIWICEIKDGSPVLTKILKNSMKFLDYDQINTSQNAETATVFGFKDPVIVKTGRYYGIVIKFQDPAYDVWQNKKGYALVKSSGVTNIPSPGSSIKSYDGHLYVPSSSNEFLKQTDVDLKFKLNIAKFKSTSLALNMVPKDYEFFSVNTISGSFKGGELVYSNIADVSAQTVTLTSNSTTLTGTGTVFTNYFGKQYMVITGATASNSGVVQIKNVINATSIELESLPSFSASGASFKVPPVGRVAYFNYPDKKLYLVGSTAANSGFKFTVGDTVKGVKTAASAKIESIDKLNVDNFEPRFTVKGPSTSKYVFTYKFTNSTNYITSSFSNLDLFKSNKVSDASYILSRSVEVLSSNLYEPLKKSALVKAQINVNVSNTNLYSVPYVVGSELDFFVYRYDVNNSYATTLYSITNYDTEIDRNGNATSKYVSKKISFSQNRYAEDIVVYLTAYRPANTEIRVYAKIHNNADAEAFDDKSWTPLELKNNANVYSKQKDESDLIEYTYGFKLYPDIRNEAYPVALVIDRGNTAIGTRDPSSATLANLDISGTFSNGDIIRLYDPLLPQNHEVFAIVGSNTSTITLNKLVTNINIPTDDAAIDKLKYKTVAFNNIANDNVARYYTSTLQEFDGFNSMQIKVVLLADNSNLVPKVDQVQVIGVSA